MFRQASLVVLFAIVPVAGCSEDRCGGLAECGGACADLDHDPGNCGACARACLDGEVCLEGVCTVASCLDECPTLGDIRCADPPDDGRVVCGGFDDDRCFEWGGFAPCDAGTTCIAGACEGGCEDECGPAGQRWCEGDGYRECGNDDGDPCLEWGAVVPCGAGLACSAGECSHGCVDDCADGERACDGDGTRTCGDFDDDACRDWSPREACGDGQGCEDGVCVELRCLDEGDDCVCGEDQCCEGHCCPFFFICISWDPQDDWCPNGPGPHA